MQLRLWYNNSKQQWSGIVAVSQLFAHLRQLVGLYRKTSWARCEMTGERSGSWITLTAFFHLIFVSAITARTCISIIYLYLYLYLYLKIQLNCRSPVPDFIGGLEWILAGPSLFPLLDSCDAEPVLLFDNSYWQLKFTLWQNSNCR